MLFFKFLYHILLIVSLLFLFLPTAIEASGSSAISGKLIPSYYILLLDKTPNSNLKKSGQNKSYDENGNEVPYGTIKDDGYYQVGITPSYTRDDTNEIVTDNITGLMWQDNSEAKSVQKQWLTDDNYDTCHNDTSSPACNDISGDTAATYCENLTLGGYNDWRLPTRDELVDIADRSKSNPTINSVFQNVVSGYYWSSSTVLTHEDGAMGVTFFDGRSYYSLKSYSFYVRCVRGDSPMMNSFSRDDSTQIVTDSKTNLQWQDNEDVITVQKSWREAINYCENLTLSGYSDWRLPNHNELYSIVSESNYNPALSSVFQNRRADHYWSSTTVISDTDYAWGINFIYGYDGYYNKSDSYYVRCVRTGQ